MPNYRIRTWDMDLQEYTPQEGVPEIVHGETGLRRALRALQGMGYSGRREYDPCVLVELHEPEAVGV